MIKVGPIGEATGIANNWEEKGNRASHIFVSFDDSGLTCIQFAFVKRGAIVLSKQHGATQNRLFRVVSLNHELEFLTGLSGMFNSTIDRITSLKFHTNIRDHEPINAIKQPGVSVTRVFNLMMGDNCEFGGFFGSCSPDGCYIESIGFYLIPRLTATEVNKPVAEWVKRESGSESKNIYSI